MAPLSPAAARLFPHYDSAALAAPEALPYLFARLLEDGSGGDLCALLGAVEETAVREWYAAHAGRALSQRSRAFWGLVLGVEAPPAPPLAHELWPLA